MPYPVTEVSGVLSLMGLPTYNLCTLLWRLARIGVRQLIKGFHSAVDRYFGTSALDMSVAHLFIVARARRALSVEHCARLMRKILG